MSVPNLNVLARDLLGVIRLEAALGRANSEEYTGYSKERHFLARRILREYFDYSVEELNREENREQNSEHH